MQVLRITQIFGDGVPFGMKHAMGIADEVTAFGLGGWVDLMRRVGIDQAAAAVKINRRYVQRLV